MRIIHVRGWIGRWLQPERVQRAVPRCLRVVVAKIVVVQARLGIVVLAGETQGCVRDAVRCPGRCAPQGSSGAPGYVAVFVDEFAGCADEVGDDGEEAGVDFLLRGVGRCDAFGLGYGA